MAPINPDYKWTKQNRLKDIPVYYIEDDIDLSFFRLELPNVISYGKHIGYIGFDSRIINGRSIQEYSSVKFEAYDHVGNTIFSAVTDYDSIHGMTSFYIDFREDLGEYKHSLKSGVGEFVILATIEGDDIPNEWKDKTNYKLTSPLIISANSLNTSPIVFKDLNKMQVSSSFQEIVLPDNTTDLVRSSSYIEVSSSYLHNYSGIINSCELYLLRSGSKPASGSKKRELFQRLSTFAPSESVFETREGSSVSSDTGMSPISFKNRVELPAGSFQNEKYHFILKYKFK